MDFNMVFLLLAPFWAAMAFINAKVMIEVNREWGSQDQTVKNVQKNDHACQATSSTFLRLFITLASMNNRSDNLLR